eukprot:10799579-Alexandrium_andersonii.AAC.1
MMSRIDSWFLGLRDSPGRHCGDVRLAQVEQPAGRTAVIGPTSEQHRAVWPGLPSAQGVETHSDTLGPSLPQRQSEDRWLLGAELSSALWSIPSGLVVFGSFC